MGQNHQTMASKLEKKAFQQRNVWISQCWPSILLFDECGLCCKELGNRCRTCAAQDWLGSAQCHRSSTVDFQCGGCQAATPDRVLIRAPQPICPAPQLRIWGMVPHDKGKIEAAVQNTFWVSELHSIMGPGRWKDVWTRADTLCAVQMEDCVQILQKGLFWGIKASNIIFDRA